MLQHGKFNLKNLIFFFKPNLNNQAWFKDIVNILESMQYIRKGYFLEKYINNNILVIPQKYTTYGFRAKNNENIAAQITHFPC